jgi:hypothetical protein
MPAPKGPDPMPLSLARRRLAGLAALAASLAVAVSAQAAGAQTLDGEQFRPHAHIEAIGVTGVCNADGPSTFTFHSFGQATGPQPGQYETYGELTLASPQGPVTAFDETFTIDGDTSIDGTTTLAETVAASCTPGSMENMDVEVRATYSTLDPFGSGPATVRIAAADGWAIHYSADFGQQAPPPPAGPTSREDCVNGGWQDYGFKNQGQCIAYVVRGGKP